MKKIYIFLLPFVYAIASIGCATSPTGRSQMLLLPESQMAELGSQTFTEMKRKIPISRDARTNNYVRCVADAILQEVGRVEGVASWEIVVFQDEQINAFALPGGKIGVYTGMFKAAKNADQLAAVLGHEVGHVTAKHGNERVSETFAISSGLELLNAATNRGGEGHGLLMAAIGAGAQFGVLLPHSRAHESEADIIGLDLMARAGFNPEESVSLWQNMSQNAGKAPPEILSTHPSNSRRINDLKENMPNANSKYRARLAQASAPDCSL